MEALAAKALAKVPEVTLPHMAATLCSNGSNEMKVLDDTKLLGFVAESAGLHGLMWSLWDATKNGLLQAFVPWLTPCQEHFQRPIGVALMDLAWQRCPTVME